jgi:hypothetical protein
MRRSPLKVMRALYDFIPENHDELSLQVGDCISVTQEDHETSWWQGINMRTNKTGAFPVNYTEEGPLTGTTSFHLVTLYALRHIDNRSFFFSK